PPEIYPVVVKPNNGSSHQNLHLVHTPQEMELLHLNERIYYLAMHYVENAGYDIKLYVTGQEVHAVRRSSPLHGAIEEAEIPVSSEMLKIARRTGQVFGLDLYGLDVLETSKGLTITDIKDFPSFYGVPRKVASVAEYILHAAYRARLQRVKNGFYVFTRQHNFLHRQDNTSIKPAELTRYSFYNRRMRQMR
ncbi:MAG TPA: hypothetical protein VFN35_00525, partial [Ktedonobacteraceae bacterium]|nr:hypothetical protein [Ktedonobacteraceae bacterium]